MAVLFKWIRSIFCISIPVDIPGGEEVMKGVYWGGDFSKVVEMIKNGEMDFKKIRFYIGYSGWSDGQLNEEIKEKSWITVQANRKLIFQTSAEDVWKESLKHLGGDYEMMIHFPTDPQLN